ncbi:PocR ligand-binding domain-containing protein [Bacillus tuaregi]|uniref:PocR ligand-binding domain-containing protein n=1 Tax=Bacillus tuaregi TaxID=1816695 RepID=UPI0008F86B0A|nr:PocR ligand-binding domain-containing protein [Bacillus tuaregi]
MEYTLNDLVETNRIKELINLFYEATGMGITILDLEGNTIVASEWKPYFTRFHHLDVNSKKVCFEKNTLDISNVLVDGKKITIYQHLDGLIDATTPITVHGKPIAVLLMSQLYLEEPLGENQKLTYMLAFLNGFTSLLAEIGLKAYRQKRAQQELQSTKEELGISQKILMAAFEELREQYARV